MMLETESVEVPVVLVVGVLNQVLARLLSSGRLCVNPKFQPGTLLPELLYG